MIRHTTYALLFAMLLAVPGSAQDRPKKRGEASPRIERQERSIVINSGGSYLGVRIKEVDADIQKTMKLGEEAGALVTDVTEKSPAAAAGIRENDVIVSWNGARVEGVRQMQRLIRETPPGRTVAIDVIRDGHRMTLKATLEKQAFPIPNIDFEGLKLDSALAGKMGQLRGRLDSLGHVLRDSLNISFDGDSFRGFHFMTRPGRLGVELQPLSPQLAKYFGVPEGAGALISAVRDSTAAAEAGLAAGDVVVSIGGESVKEPADVARLIRDREAGPVEIKVIRDHREQVVNVRLPERRKGGAQEGMFQFFGPEDMQFYGHFDAEPDSVFQWFDPDDMPMAPDMNGAPLPPAPPVPPGDVELV